MPRPLIHLYVAVSLDGFIADTSGNTQWLQPYIADIGLAAFLTQIGTIVTGRQSFDRTRGFRPSGDRGKRVVVLTHRPLAPDSPPDVEAYDGDIAALARRLKRESEGDIWIVGGGTVAHAFLERGFVDRIALYIIPVLLGDGARLLAPGERMHAHVVSEAKAFPNGIVGLFYDLAPALHAV